MDFRPSNLLLKLKSLEGLGEEQIFTVFGDPETTDVHVRQDSRQNRPGRRGIGARKELPAWKT